MEDAYYAFVKPAEYTTQRMTLNVSDGLQLIITYQYCSAIVNKCATQM